MFQHPVWLVGFRPFFTLACGAGVLYPLLWALAFAGRLQLPPGLSPMQWHMHEMLFGFGWAVLGGFLLTASKNWVNVRGLHGGPLALAVLLWFIERLALFLPAEGSPALARTVLLNAFGVYVFGYVVWTLVRHRKQDSFSDNGFFVVGLPLFVVAKNLTLSPASSAAGAALAIGMYRLAFAVMFERTMTQFMKGAFGVVLPRRRALDLAIKGLVLAAAFEAFLPTALAVAVLCIAALLLLLRLLTWSPHLGLRRFDTGIMYAGYLGLSVHLVLAALRSSGLYAGVGQLAVHAFAFLCMGLVIPAMLIRISQGHTGRKPLFTTGDRVALGLMALGAAARLLATQLWPSAYVAWVTLSALGFSACFLLVGLRLVPFLWQPRIDGREH